MVQFAVSLSNFGTLVSYIIIVKDLALPAVRLVAPEGSVRTNCAFIMAVATILVMLPLSLLREVKWLSYTSFVAVVLYAMFVVVVIVRYGTLGGSMMSNPIFSVRFTLYVLVILVRFVCL